MKTRRILLCLLFAAIAFVMAARENMLTDEEIAWNKIADVEDLYFKTEYKICSSLVESYIKAAEDKSEYFPGKAIARLYRLKAYLAYAFREEGYEEVVRDCFRKAVELDLDLTTHEPGMIPSYVFNKFNAVKKEYLDQYSRMERRTEIGVFGSLVFDLNALSDIPDILQPGIHVSYNLSETISLAFDMRLPLQLLFQSDLSLRGQLGLLLYPSFRIERLYMGASLYYLFNLDNVFTDFAFSQSLSFCNQSEIIFRNGIGAGANVEIVRFDLLFLTDKTQVPPDYRSYYLFPGFLRMAFANLSFFFFYAF